MDVSKLTLQINGTRLMVRFLCNTLDENESGCSERAVFLGATCASCFISTMSRILSRLVTCDIGDCCLIIVVALSSC